jgi:sugar phosphate isomerase/epimerase
MSRPITLFTGQWADLPLETIAQKVSEWGYDGLELACSGDHFDVQKALSEDAYVRQQRDLLEKYNLKCWAISNHLVGQAVCDPIDDRHKSIVPDYVWGDGDPAGVQERAAEEMKRTAQAARLFGADVVSGFTGSSVWHKLYFFPPTSQAEIDAGYQDFADRWLPILDEFKTNGVKFGLEVHPTEIAYDIITSARALEAVNQHESFCFNFDPSHLIHPVHRSGGIHQRIPGPYRARPREGLASHAHRPQQHPQFTSGHLAITGAAGTLSPPVTAMSNSTRSSGP